LSHPQHGAKSVVVLDTRPLIAGVLVVALAGCATQADIQALSEEQRRLSGRLADTRASLEAMQRDLARLRGGIDEVRHAGGETRGVTSERLEILEQRVMSLETAPTAAATPAPGAVSPDGAAQSVASGDATGREEGDVPEEYRQGLSLFRAGDYDRAIQAFRGFLRTNGESPLAPNAQYWIGDSYFMLGDYYQAILNFNDVRQRHPNSDRAPASVLKIGQAFSKMGNKTEAKLAFQKVVKDYPSSSEANEAREQLRALER
jgi:tol-pal system protein YbgF